MNARTLFLSHSATMGGAEFCLLDIAHSLRERALVVLLEDGPFRERLEDADVPVRVIAAGALHEVRRDSRLPSVSALAGLWKTAGAVSRIAAEFDVIHANSQKALIVGSIAAKRAQKPLVWHLHDIIERPWFSTLNIFADVLLTNHGTERVLAVSRATADALVRQGGNAEKIHVVYNGIDAVQFDVTPLAIAQLRQSLGLSAVPVVGCFSRLANWKGQHVLIEAVSELPGVHVLLVGGALFGEHAYERVLREMVQRLGLADRVHFLGQRDDVSMLMHTVDLVVHPSTAPEPFARTLIESMLAGRAPIASACGGVPELIESGRNGFLVPPGDATALRGILQHLLESPQQMEEAANVARTHAKTHFAKATYVNAVTAHLEAAANSRAEHNSQRALHGVSA